VGSSRDAREDNENVQADTLVEQQVDQADAPAPAPVQDEAPAQQQPEESKPAKRVKSTAKKTRTVELTLTVTGTADGEWQADLVHGTKRVVQGLVIPATAVSRAAKELHEDIAGGIEEVIETARAQHRTRMEELEAELAKVKAALADLTED
jgi:polyhydroxyalkanoate synthesis regulator phasin